MKSRRKSRRAECEDERQTKEAGCLYYGDGALWLYAADAGFRRTFAVPIAGRN